MTRRQVWAVKVAGWAALIGGALAFQHGLHDVAALAYYAAGVAGGFSIPLLAGLLTFAEQPGAAKGE